jgi:hypothetical protein
MGIFYARRGREKPTDQGEIRAGRRELRSSCCAIRMILLRRERADYQAASSCAAPLEFPFLLFPPNQQRQLFRRWPRSRMGAFHQICAIADGVDGVCVIFNCCERLHRIGSGGCGCRHQVRCPVMRRHQMHPRIDVIISTAV